MSKTIKLCSWNINGIRAVAKKGFLDWLADSNCDIVCLQEIKAQRDQLGSELTEIPGYPFVEFNSAERKGYSGVANLIRDSLVPERYNFGFELERFSDTPIEITNVDQGKKETLLEFKGIKEALGPQNLYTELDTTALLERLDAAKKISKSKLKEHIQAFNDEGRVIETHHKLGKDSFVLFNIYFPNGGASTERLKFKLDFYEAFLLYIQELQKTQPNIVITGDYNTAHEAIDLARPKQNTNTSGFMPVERIYLDRLEALGFKDSFRHFNPELGEHYTWWSFRTAARQRNIGWRIDYFYVSEALLPKLKSAQIHTDTLGSDHCPISIELELGKLSHK
ncbi:MAG: exodeoxyribonuclease III [Candidatus Melainabacteria bacterium]|nr:exodeoxyribonuclease III [Candidatus Melainabacteria bacterium]